MKLLLDTHALIWWLTDDPQLGSHVSELLADPNHEVLVSVVSLWEIVVKQRIGKLDVDVSEVSRAVEHGDFTLVNITPEHLKTLSSLPAHHRDPFDHLLMAQAVTETAIFLTDDRRVRQYPVQTMTCSDQSPRPGTL